MTNSASGKAAVVLEMSGPIALVTLNRPESLNAFNAAMHAALMSTLDQIEGDEACRVAVLTGAGRGFCTGQDLTDRAGVAEGKSVDLGASLEQFYNPLVQRLRGLRVPIVCAVNGVAAGAGANIALHCDIVLAAKSARFIQAFAKIGLIPDCGGTWILPRLIGSARASAITMLAEPVSADLAASWGLIWRAVEDDMLLDEAMATASKLAAMPAGALHELRTALQLAAVNTLDQQLEHEALVQRQLGRSQDYADGVTAFLKARAARASGGKAS